MGEFSIFGFLFSHVLWIYSVSIFYAYGDADDGDAFSLKEVGCLECHMTYIFPLRNSDAWR